MRAFLGHCIFLYRYFKKIWRAKLRSKLYSVLKSLTKWTHGCIQRSSWRVRREARGLRRAWARAAREAARAPPASPPSPARAPTVCRPPAHNEAPLRHSPMSMKGYLVRICSFQVIRSRMDTLKTHVGMWFFLHLAFKNRKKMLILVAVTLMPFYHCNTNFECNKL